VLVRLVHKFPNPPNKDVGEGLNTAFDEMKNSRLKPPLIRETETAVVVEIRHDRLASPEESVMDYLANHAEITNRVARELTGIRSENTMKLTFLRLAKLDLIKRIPGRKGASSAWQKYGALPNLNLSPAQERYLQKWKARLAMAENGERWDGDQPYTVEEQAAEIANIRRRIASLTSR
jgi:ATP-dependent DNA helicase RecG